MDKFKLWLTKLKNRMHFEWCIHKLDKGAKKLGRLLYKANLDSIADTANSLRRVMDSNNLLATGERLDNLAAMIGICRDYSADETDDELRKRCKDITLGLGNEVPEPEPCKCEIIFKNARDFKLTRKAFRDIETLNLLFIPMKNNEYKCSECGAVYTRDWGKRCG